MGTVGLTKIQETELEMAELKMMRFILGATWMDSIGIEYIRGTAQVRFLEKKLKRLA